jgi:hypothetical protein
MKRTIRFVHKKDTAKTRVYEEVPQQGQPPVVGTIYVQKWAAGDATEVTVELTIGTQE